MHYGFESGMENAVYCFLLPSLWGLAEYLLGRNLVGKTALPKNFNVFQLSVDEI